MTLRIECANGLGADLAAMGYTEAALRDLVGGPAPWAALLNDQISAARWHIERVWSQEFGTDWTAIAWDRAAGEADQRADLRRAQALWFGALRGTLSGTALAAAFPNSRVEGLVAGGFAKPCDDGESGGGQVRYRACFDLITLPGAGWVVADIAPPKTGQRARMDHVMGVGGASRSLLNFTSRRPVGSLFDLGTGCGVQALGAAHHATTIIASDLHERALELARFNLALNGVTAQLKAGSLYQPVAGQRFDAIVANPPFVITPPRVREILARDLGPNRDPGGGDGPAPVQQYRDAGMDGDELVRAVVTGAQSHLNPGGRAYFLANWLIPTTALEAQGDAAQAWAGPVAEWLAAAAVDSWVVLRELLDPASYAATWLRDGGLHPGESAYEEAMCAYLDAFAQAGVGAIGFGYLALQAPPDTPRPPAPGFGLGHRYRADERGYLRAWIDGRDGLAPSGETVDWVFDTLELVRAPGDILDTHFEVVPGVIEQRYATPGATDPQLIRLAQGSHLGAQIGIGTITAGFVSACDGQLSARQILTAIAALLDLDAGAVCTEQRPLIVDLLAAGFIQPAAPPSPGTD